MAVVKRLLEAGKLTPVVDRTYLLSEVSEAIRYLEGMSPATTDQALADARLETPYLRGTLWQPAHGQADPTDRTGELGNN